MSGRQPRRGTFPFVLAACVVLIAVGLGWSLSFALALAAAVGLVVMLLNARGRSDIARGRSHAATTLPPSTVVIRHFGQNGGSAR